MKNKRHNDGFEMSEGEHNNRQRRSEGDGECDKASSQTITERDAEDLITRMIKNIFPPLNVQSALLSDCRRVVLYRRDHRPSASSSSPSPSPSSSSPPVTYQFRQYAIVRRAAGITSGVRRLVEASTKAAARRSLLRSLGLREGEKRIDLTYGEEEEDEKGVKKENKRDLLAKKTLHVKSEAGSVRVKREDDEDKELDEEDKASSSGGEEEKERRRVERKRRRRDDICDITLKKEKRTETDSEPEDEEDIIEMDRQAARYAVSRNSQTLSQRRGGDALSALIRSSSSIRRKKSQGGEGEEGKEEDEEEGMVEDHENSEEPSSYTKTCKMAISLIELGPRMELQLVKIEDDVCTGAVLYHNFISKTPEELQQLKEKEASLKAKRQKELDEMERVVEVQLKKRKKNREGGGEEEEERENESSNEEEEPTSKGVKSKDHVNHRGEFSSSEKQMLEEFTDQDGNSFYGLKNEKLLRKGEEEKKKKSRGEESSLSGQKATGSTADEDTGDEEEDDEEEEGESDDENDGDDEGLGDSDSESTEDGGGGEKEERTRQKFHPFSFKKKKKKLSTEEETAKERVHLHRPNQKCFQKKNKKKRGEKSQKRMEGNKRSVNANVMQKYQMAKKAQQQQQRGG